MSIASEIWQKWLFSTEVLLPITPTFPFLKFACVPLPSLPLSRPVSLGSVPLPSVSLKWVSVAADRISPVTYRSPLTFRFKRRGCFTQNHSKSNHTFERVVASPWVVLSTQIPHVYHFVHLLRPSCHAILPRHLIISSLSTCSSCMVSFTWCPPSSVMTWFDLRG